MKIKLAGSKLKQIRDISISLVVIITTLFLTGKLVLPKMIQIPDFHKRLKKNQSQVQDLEKKAAFLKEQKEGILFADFEKVEQVLPSEKDVAALLISLENLKKNLNIRFDNLDLKAGLLATAAAETNYKKDQSQQEFDLGLTLVASYDDLIKFLAKTENTAPLMSAKKVDINFLSGKEKINARCFLKTHYLMLKEEKLSLEKPLPKLSSSLQGTLEQVLGFEVFTEATPLPEEMIGKEDPFGLTEEKEEEEGTPSASY